MLGYWVWQEPSVHEARTVLGYLGEGGGYDLDKDAFGRRLLDFAFKCDRQNLGLLALGFPGYCSAVWAYKQDDDGLARIQQVAGQRLPTQPQPLVQALTEFFDGVERQKREGSGGRNAGELGGDTAGERSG